MSFRPKSWHWINHLVDVFFSENCHFQNYQKYLVQTSH